MADERPPVVRVELINPPLADPWRTRQDYIDDQKRSRRLAIVAVVSILISALATVGTFVGALTALRSQTPQAGAWVLWEEEVRTDAQDRSHTSWRIENATPGGTAPGQKISGYEFCAGQREPFAQVTANNSKGYPNLKEVQTAPGLVIVIFKGKGDENGGQILTRFLCLPDTVDPRGPKGR